VAGEKRFVVGDVLDAHYALGFELNNAVHQQERVPVRENVRISLMFKMAME